MVVTPRPLTYIEQIAADIYVESGGTDYEPYPPHESAMWLGYAVLALAKGTATTSEDVHDAWVAWSVDIDYRHRSNVPFDQLPAHVQAYDDQYRDAIRTVAARLALLAVASRADEEAER